MTTNSQTAAGLTTGFTKEEMARAVIERLPVGATVNLGIGLPTLVAELVPADRHVVIHSENGVLGVSGRPVKGKASPTLINAGKETIAVGPGASYFDSALSFGMIRGGHIDFCVLGGFQVDRKGSLANWMIPGQKIAGIGGAMDLVNGAKQVIVMMTHFAKDGRPKLVDACTLPLTGVEVVNVIVTDLGVFRPTGEGFVAERLAPGVSRDGLGLGSLLIDDEAIGGSL